MIGIDTQNEKRVSQGDVIRDVEFVEDISEEDGVLEISRIRFPLVIVLTQDCDLQQYHTGSLKSEDIQDKWLVSVLVAPLYNIAHVAVGEHLTDIGIRSASINMKKTDGMNLKTNQKPRYHYLDFPSDCGVVPSVIDFKHYFSVPITYLSKRKEVGFECKVKELFREDISQRFAAFLSRIGLPELR